MLTATIRSRIEPELKEEATRILESCGLDLSTAIRLFLNNVVVAKGLPFDISPNPTTVAAMEEARKLSARFSSPKEFFDELEGKNASKEGRKKVSKPDAGKSKRR
ncbi:type II toxin-antitoxin system RelB/DinJ family antitoxin [Oxalobacteraceae bacterium OTU3REALA1]|nr:type II toxin-antitoxin system RelB/DinJ family antitoxin [Oxalobacteraceae bacterium OTU3REALA1]